MRLSIRPVLVVMAFALSGSSRAAEPPEEPVYQGKTLGEWIGDLKKSAASTRYTAAQALHVFGPAKGVVPALAAAIKDGDRVVVIYAAQTLGKLGPRAREALPALRAAFKGVEAEPPQNNVSAIPQGVNITQARRAIAEALVLIDDRPGPELAPALLEAFRSDDASKRRAVVAALGKLGPDAAKITVPALLSALEDKDGAVRLEAVNSLGRIGSAAKPAVHALTLTLVQGRREKIGFSETVEFGLHTLTEVYGNREMCIACADALGRIHPGAAGRVAAMRVALRDLDDDVRGAALFVLKETVTDAADLLPLLRPLLRDKEVSLRQSALAAMGKAKGTANQVVSVLVAALKDENAVMRARAAALLGSRGNAAKQAVPALLGALKDADADVRAAAAKSLGAVAAKDKGAIRALTAALDDREESVFLAAAVALTKSGSQVQAAVPRLLALSALPDPKRRAEACLVLGYFGPVAKGALPALEKLSKDDPQDYVRLAAQVGIAKIDATWSKGVIQLLTAALDINSTSVIKTALLGLQAFGSESRVALPALRALRERTSDRGVQLSIDGVIEAIEKSEKGSPR